MSLTLPPTSFVTSDTDVFQDSGWAWTQSLGSAPQISGGSVGPRPPAQPLLTLLPHPLSPAAVGQERQVSPACECPGTVVCLPVGSPTLEGDMGQEATQSSVSPPRLEGLPLSLSFPICKSRWSAGRCHSE